MRHECPDISNTFIRQITKTISIILVTQLLPESIENEARELSVSSEVLSCINSVFGVC